MPEDLDYDWPEDDREDDRYLCETCGKRYCHNQCPRNRRGTFIKICYNPSGDVDE